MDDILAAVRPVPVLGARRAAYAALGLKDLIRGIHLLTVGYVGVQRIGIVPGQRRPGCGLREHHAQPSITPSRT
jgi:hypothetical protein